MSAPCQTNCRSAQAIACATGCWSMSLLGITSLPACFNQFPDFPEFLRRSASRVERLHDQLGRGPAKGAVEQVADELPLGLFLAQPRAVDVGAVGVVAADQPLLRHDLQQLERSGV